MEWKQGIVRDLAEAFSGFAFPSSDLVDVGVPVLKIGNVQRGLVTSNVDSYYNGVITKRLEKFILKKDDFLIAMTGAGSVGRVGKMHNMSGLYLVNQRVAIVRPRQDDGGFLYYLMSMPYIEKYLYSLGIGAGQPNISANDILNTKILIPPYATQQKISSILSAYDSQIENYQKRIKLLEQMTENLYKEWFVRFRFPGYKNTEFESGLPKGWKRITLTDFLDFQKGVEPGSDAYSEDSSLTPFYRVGDVEDKKPTIFVDVNLLPKYQLASPTDVLCSFDGTIGKVSIGLDGVYSSGLCRIRPKNKGISMAFVYYLMKSQPIQNTIQTFANGSTILHAGKSIKKLQTYFDSSIVEQFGRIATPLLNEVLALEKAIQQLSIQRDLLLPRLMSGKLSI